MVCGKKMAGIDDTLENVAKAMFRSDRLPKRKREAKAKNTEGQTVKVVVVDTGD